ncbi:DUF3263 domain-containing protein [Leifsonia sp. A12D58]|uniref:DUF3263 domain-containing protein n=1 Tax=Leifsonia sp. A12D58 TaxID=3397674 RepID=UPI0039E07CDC
MQNAKDAERVASSVADGSSEPDGHSPSSRAAGTGLSERDLAVLAFERQWWRHVGAKEEAIRSELGLSSARYYQVLGALIEEPAALVHDPMLVNRLQRMREARAESRARRSITPDQSTPVPADRVTTLPRTESD